MNFSREWAHTPIKEREALYQEGKLNCGQRDDPGYLAVSVKNILADPEFADDFREHNVQSAHQLDKQRMAIAECIKPVGLLSESRHEFRLFAAGAYLERTVTLDNNCPFDRAWIKYLQELDEQSESDKTRLQQLVSQLCHENYHQSRTHRGSRSYRGIRSANRLAKQFGIDKDYANKLLKAYDRLPEGPLDNHFYQEEKHPEAHKKVQVVMEKLPSGRLVARGITGTETLNNLLDNQQFRQTRQAMKRHLEKRKKAAQRPVKTEEEGPGKKAEILKQLEAIGLQHPTGHISQEAYDRETERLMQELELITSRQDGETSELARRAEHQQLDWTEDERHWYVLEKKLTAYENRCKEDCLLAEVQANEEEKRKNSRVSGFRTQNVSATRVAEMASQLPELKERWQGWNQKSIERRVQRRIKALDWGVR